MSGYDSFPEGEMPFPGTFSRPGGRLFLPDRPPFLMERGLFVGGAGFLPLFSLKTIANEACGGVQ